MSPIKPKGPAVPPMPSASTKLDDTDQTIAEPPRDFTDEIFQQLTGVRAPPPAAGAPPQATRAPPSITDLDAPQAFKTQPMYNAPQAFNAPPAYGAPKGAPVAPPPFVPQQQPVPQSPPQSAPSPVVRVHTPLWAILYIGIAVLAIAFGLFVLLMQSRVLGHF